MAHYYHAHGEGKGQIGRQVGSALLLVMATGLGSVEHQVVGVSVRYTVKAEYSQASDNEPKHATMNVGFSPRYFCRRPVL